MLTAKSSLHIQLDVLTKFPSILSTGPTDVSKILLGSRLVLHASCSMAVGSHSLSGSALAHMQRCGTELLLNTMRQHFVPVTKGSP